MKKEKINSKEPEERKEKEGIFWNTFWLLCISLSIVLISISCFLVNEFIDSLFVLVCYCGAKIRKNE